MGIYEKPTPAFLDRLERTMGFTVPRKHGYDTVEAIHAMHSGKARVFIAMGGNFLSATPDTRYTAEALQNCSLTVQVSTKLNRSHLITGEEALILPTYGRSDKDEIDGEIQFVSCENSMGVVQWSKGSLNPVSTYLLSEPVIVARLATALFGDASSIDWKKYQRHYDRIRDDIEKAIPGFEDYNRRVREPGGFYLPNSARDGRFNTSSGSIRFHIAPLSQAELQDGEYMMMTIRSHDQFNTTIYGLNDRYRGVLNERRVIFMNENDVIREGLKQGDLVDLFNHHENRERVAHRFIVIPYSIPERCTATYFPETNVLVPINSVAEKSNTPTSKSVAIRIRKSAD